MAGEGGQVTIEPISGTGDPGVTITLHRDRNPTTPPSMDTTLTTSRGLLMATTEGWKQLLIKTWLPNTTQVCVSSLGGSHPACVREWRRGGCWGYKLRLQTLQLACPGTLASA